MSVGSYQQNPKIKPIEFSTDEKANKEGGFKALKSRSLEGHRQYKFKESFGGVNIMNYLDYLAQRSLSYEKFMEKLFKEGVGFIPNDGVTCKPESNYTTYLKQRSAAYERLLSELQANAVFDNIDKEQDIFASEAEVNEIPDNISPYAAPDNFISSDSMFSGSGGNQAGCSTPADVFKSQDDDWKSWNDEYEEQ